MALILRNGGSQSPDRWLKEPRNNHKKLLELASDAGAIYRIDGTVLIRRDIFDDYLERFHEPATGKDKEKKTDEW